MVAYCFAEIPGFSKFGSYVGNLSADGPFIHCGFRPRWIMFKRLDSPWNWVVIDTARDTYNVAQNFLSPNTSGAESSGANYIDILSTGFKIKDGGNNNVNGSGVTHIYAAFAEHPFGGSNVAPCPAR
jgi:hypothetical protein